MTRWRDHYTDRARAQGYPARSVFKLDEIDRRLKLLRRGQHVLDLGAAPGSWTLYAAGRVGDTGSVTAVDLTPLSSAMPPHVRSITADVYQLPPPETWLPAPKIDVVLSDMAPKTSGTRDVDQARSYQLFEHALQIAIQTLKPGGSFVGKIFQGPDFENARKLVREHFQKAEIIRPSATRKQSYEIFISGLNFQG